MGGDVMGQQIISSRKKYLSPRSILLLTLLWLFVGLQIGQSWSGRTREVTVPTTFEKQQLTSFVERGLEETETYFINFNISALGDVSAHTESQKRSIQKFFQLMEEVSSTPRRQLSSSMFDEALAGFDLLTATVQHGCLIFPEHIKSSQDEMAYYAATYHQYVIPFQKYATLFYNILETHHKLEGPWGAQEIRYTRDNLQRRLIFLQDEGGVLPVLQLLGRLSPAQDSFVLQAVPYGATMVQMDPPPCKRSLFYHSSTGAIMTNSVLQVSKVNRMGEEFFRFSFLHGLNTDKPFHQNMLSISVPTRDLSRYDLGGVVASALVGDWFQYNQKPLVIPMDLEANESDMLQLLILEDIQRSRRAIADKIEETRFTLEQLTQKLEELSRPQDAVPQDAASEGEGFSDAGPSVESGQNRLLELFQIKIEKTERSLQDLSHALEEEDATIASIEAAYDNKSLEAILEEQRNKVATSLLSSQEEEFQDATPVDTSAEAILKRKERKASLKKAKPKRHKRGRGGGSARGSRRDGAPSSSSDTGAGSSHSDAVRRQLFDKFKVESAVKFRELRKILTGIVKKYGPEHMDIFKRGSHFSYHIQSQTAGNIEGCASATESTPGGGFTLVTPHGSGEGSNPTVPASRANHLIEKVLEKLNGMPR